MASRIVVGRFPSLALPSSLRRCVPLRILTTRPFSLISRRTPPSSILSVDSRKPVRFLNASIIFTLQTRYYADTIIKVPQMAESISEGTLKQWQKKVGDFVQQDEEIATIETDKIDVAVNSTETGTIVELLANEEDTVVVGQDLAKIKPGNAPEGGSSSEPPKKETAKQEPKAPADPKQEPGTKQAPPKEVREEHTPPQKSTPPPPSPKEEPKQSSPAYQGIGNREERRVKMSRMRLRIAERLKESQNTAASLTTFNEIDMTNLMEMRKLYKDAVMEKTGVKLGFMSAFSRAAVKAMEDVPAVNASIEGPAGGDTIVYRDYVDISVAVATEKGLVTPIVRNAEELDMIQIEAAIAALGTKAREGKLTIEDMAGGTFTISNGGVFGSLFGTPIINLPQTAVLGLHAIKEKPVAVDGKVLIRPIMIVALTYDHRLLDGKEAVTFLVKIKNYIEDPRRLLLGV